MKFNKLVNLNEDQDKKIDELISVYDFKECAKMLGDTSKQCIEMLNYDARETLKRTLKSKKICVTRFFIGEYINGNLYLYFVPYQKSIEI